jgi:hypothetical protein
MDLRARRAHIARMRAPDPETAPSLITRQFLAWVAAAPRSYGETMEAWRTSCPRLSVWEDAVSDGLVAVESAGASMRAARVTLTARGEAALARCAKS